MESHTNAIRDDNNVYSDGTDLVRNNGQGNQRSNRLPSRFVVQLTLTASLGGCLFGYDMGAIGGTLPQLTSTFDLDDRKKELSKCCQSLPYFFRQRLLTCTNFETIDVRSQFCSESC